MKALLLSAGLGTRLRPLTDSWPKCLMPIGGVPLLEYWIDAVRKMGIDGVVVNTHYLSREVGAFLERPCFTGFVSAAPEERLLGTAGTIRANSHRYRGESLVLVHADNWCVCDFKAFADFHRFKRPLSSVMTMMTFTTDTPESCGIIDTDENGLVKVYHEKPTNPSGNFANAAVYILEPEVLEWLEARPWISDFSTEVIPEFIGRIATWHNDGIHRDIGTPRSLKIAQQDEAPFPPRSDDSWIQWFRNHPVHQMVDRL